jgi:dTDP-4-dehydrorhamnose 3,5-epimerase
VPPSLAWAAVRDRCELHIDGVGVRPLVEHVDARGGLVELRAEEGPDDPVVLWVRVRSAANVVRGVHVHLRKVDRVYAAVGETLVWLRDLRPGSATSGAAASVWLRAAEPMELTIPPGVAHGFYNDEPATLLVANDRLYDPGDDLGCSWADPALGFTWPCEAPVVSERDAAAGSLASLEAAVARAL